MLQHFVAKHIARALGLLTSCEKVQMSSGGYVQRATVCIDKNEQKSEKTSV